MNDDYLWDKSGEPDPQIQQLEEILGTLRYQPQPLNLPRRRNYLALLAIAATVVMALLAGALWTQIQRQEASIPEIAIVEPAPVKANPFYTSSPLAPAKRKPRLTRHDRQEALAAKQQLMFALRLASEKLNAASRRTQHKAG
jgi:negative regulator of sigma E activity